MQSLRVLLPGLASTVLLALAGCPAGDDATADIDASPQCEAAKQHSDLAWIQENVFTPSCSNFTACHQGAASQAGGLDLSPGHAHDALVNVTSQQFPTWKLLVPGQPMMSYIMVALGQYEGPLDPRVGTMPYNSRLLCQEKRDAIERWIAAGAPADSPVDAGVDGP
ncbi:MAG TPA: hypothetical protein VHE35_01865 [Kofleriaceae bacterium]|nr:hypothetical protein [Kofleriaceae bacterium]